MASQARPPIDERRRRGLTRVGAVIVLTLAVLYAIGLAGMSAANRQARQKEQRLGAEVDRLRTQVPAIRAAAATATTDAALDESIRRDRNWVLPGDHPIVVVTATVTSPTPGVGAPGAPSWVDRFRDWIGAHD